MRRVSLSSSYRRFGWKSPHNLNVRVGYRGGVRL